MPNRQSPPGEGGCSPAGGSAACDRPCPMRSQGQRRSAVPQRLEARRARAIRRSWHPLRPEMPLARARP
eukprot:5219628-Pyramimonas_sp.AAC.1